MTLPRVLLLAVAGLVMLPLSGCLEVEQHPPWRNGQYDGKQDDRPEKTHFARDRLAWNAAIINRNHRQNEYRRMP